MKLIFIYGQPASGKLTIAKELAILTKYKLFHGHLTFDVIRSLFEFDSKACFRMANKIRLDLLEEAAKERLRGVIFTFCYAPMSKKFVKDLIKRVEKHKGRVYFVQICCENKALFKRVKESSRKQYTKIKTVKHLKESLKSCGFSSPIPFVKSLKINNTKLSPKKIALIIKQHYKL